LGWGTDPNHRYAIDTLIAIYNSSYAEGVAFCMAKGKGKSKPSSGQRVRTNPVTGNQETVAGTKAGKKRTRLPFGHELRTHDMHGIVKKGKKKTKYSDED
jgi:hypothetical protein